MVSMLIIFRIYFIYSCLFLNSLQQITQHGFYVYYNERAPPIIVEAIYGPGSVPPSMILRASSHIEEGHSDVIALGLQHFKNACVMVIIGILSSFIALCIEIVRKNIVKWEGNQSKVAVTSAVIINPRRIVGTVGLAKKSIVTSTGILGMKRSRSADVVKLNSRLRRNNRNAHVKSSVNRINDNR